MKQYKQNCFIAFLQMKNMKKVTPHLQESQNHISFNDTIQQPKPKNPTKAKLKPLMNKLQLSKISKTLKNHQKSTTHIAATPVTSDRNRLSAIRYKSFDTIKYNKDYNMFEQTDSTFCNDVKYICEKNKNVLGNIFSLTEKNKNELSDTQCDEIDYIARKHYKANRINESYRVEKNQFKNQIQRCPCGCDKYRGNRIPFWTSMSQLKFLGSGALLIFMFIRNYAIVMTLALIIYGVFALTTNLIGGATDSSNICTDDWCRFIYNSANNNKIEPHPMMIAQWWLGLVFCIVWLMATRVTKHNGRIMNKEIDRKLASASDKAVLIRKLPQGDFTEAQLMQYFQRLWFRRKRQMKADPNQDEQNTRYSKKQFQNDSQQDNCNNFNVQSIQIIYSMEFARKINLKIIELSKQINYVLETKPNLQDPKKSHRLMKNRAEYTKIKEELIQFIEILGDLRNKFMHQQNFRKSLSSELCIVQFKSESAKDQLLESFGKQKVGLLTQVQENIKNCFLKKTQESLGFKGKQIKIERAPEPSDIQWQKCQLQYSTRRTFGLYMLTIVIVGVSLGLVLALDRLQDFVDTQAKAGYFSKDSIVLSVINVFTAIILQLVNKFLWWSLAYMIQNQVNYTLSERIISRMNKALFATSVNIIALPLITNYVFKVDVFSTKGMTGMIFDYQISTLFIGLPLKLFNPTELLSRLALYVRAVRNWIIRYYCMELNMAEENVKQKGIKIINNLYEGEYFDVAEGYVYIMGTIYHSVFFCQINPAVLITGTLIAIGFFFVLKAKLFYFCKSPEMLDLSVFETALSQACLVPILYGAGAIVLTYIQNQIDPMRPVEYHQAIICIALSLGFFFNPGDIFNKLAKLGVDCLKKIKDDTKKEDKGKVQNLDTYYKGSNSLQLLGFEKVLKGASLDITIQNELKRFCTQFIPKSKESLYVRDKDDTQSEHQKQVQKIDKQKN